MTIGPWIDNGFYYDFDTPEAFTDDDLKKIKKEMDRIIRENLPLTRETVSREEAERRIKEINEPYKLEILEGLKEPITIYHMGDQWWDLCAGPHVETTGALAPKAIALESVAGTFFRRFPSTPNATLPFPSRFFAFCAVWISRFLALAFSWSGLSLRRVRCCIVSVGMYVV